MLKKHTRLEMFNRKKYEPHNRAMNSLTVLKNVQAKLQTKCSNIYFNILPAHFSISPNHFIYM